MQRIDSYLENAAYCADRARQETNPERRRRLAREEQDWLELARHHRAEGSFNLVQKVMEAATSH